LYTICSYYICYIGLPGDGNKDGKILRDESDNIIEPCPSNTKNFAHTYSNAGDYNIKIYGKKFTGFDSRQNSTYASKVIKIYSMGKWENVISMAFLCEGCTKLNYVSSNAFMYLTKVTNFRSLFYNASSLKSIPNGLFKYNAKAGGFYTTFIRTSLTSIPKDLFKYSVEANDFNSTFSNTIKCQEVYDIARDNK
jgi:hypothetical protein